MSTLKYIFWSMITVATLVSCKKEDDYNFTGDPEVKFFTNNDAPGNAPPNSISYAVINIPDAAGAGWLNLSTTLPSAVRFPVRASSPVSQEVTIGAQLDNSMIDAYNAAHNTSYLPFPAGILNTEALSARIAAGATLSADSISIVTNAAGLNGLTEKAYMAPIVLKTVSNPAVGAITSNSTIQVTYVVVNVEQRRIKYNAPAADALGTLVADRSAWTAVLTPTPVMVNGGGSILDGSTTSYSRWGVSSTQVDLNMQSLTNVTGIRIHTSTSSTTSPTQVEVLLSEDGITYDRIGAPLRADLVYASGYTHILFYKESPAKYVRLMLTYSTSTNSQNRRLTELDIYAN